MKTLKADIISQLKKELLPLQGYKKASNYASMDVLPAAIKNAFPNGEFATGAVHEFISSGSENAAATCGFISGILASLIRQRGACIWINFSKTIFPPALKSFGITPGKVIFIHLKKEKEILWAMEEALKYPGLSAVVGEMHELNFTASRRLQLAVEESMVTGFILRHQPKNLNTTACLTRWKIQSIASELTGGMPGVGFPRWEVELQKVRNGKPGIWEIECKAGRFRQIPKKIIIQEQEQRKTG